MDLSIVDLLNDELPQILWRHRWDEYRESGAPFKKRSLEKYDSIGEGPKNQRIAGRVVYRKKDFLSWLASREFGVEWPQENGNSILN